MTPDTFIAAVRQLCLQFGGSVTSWGRTEAHTKAVGGFSGDPHTHWYGADVVWDHGSLPGSNLFESPVVSVCSMELSCLHEKDHDHFQPLTYPAGPLTHEQVAAWEASYLQKNVSS